MDWQGRDLDSERIEGFGGEGTVAFRDDVSREVPQAVAEALADPIVQALMIADHVAPETVAGSLCASPLRFASLHRPGNGANIDDSTQRTGEDRDRYNPYERVEQRGRPHGLDGLCATERDQGGVRGQHCDVSDAGCGNPGRPRGTPDRRRWAAAPDALGDNQVGRRNGLAKEGLELVIQVTQHWFGHRLATEMFGNRAISVPL
jgi:hypothetical protein